MTCLLATADLHLTHKSEDGYRWDIFPWLERRIRHYQVDALLILGDLTDSKDHHPARLVNRIVSELSTLSAQLPQGLHVLMGNHDYNDPGCPFFQFLSAHDNIFFYDELRLARIGDLTCLMMPHSREPLEQNKKARKVYKKGHDKYGSVDLVCFHQPVKDAKLPTGNLLEGMTADRAFRPFRKSCILGGDIHVPQLLRDNLVRLRYCGAPYPINFGDDYQPRVLLYRNGKLKSLKRQTIRKVTARIQELDDLESYELTSGDQVKVILELPRSEFSAWLEHKGHIKSWAEEHEVQLKGLELKEQSTRERLTEDSPKKKQVADPNKLLKQYCKVNRDRIKKDLRKAGLKFVDQVCE